MKRLLALILITVFTLSSGNVIYTSAATLVQGNLAYQKTVTVLGPNTNSNNFSVNMYSGSVPSNLTDGNVASNNTLWTNIGTAVKADGDSGAFIVDLGTTTQFTNFKFYRQANSPRASQFDYEVLYSDSKPSSLSDLTNTTTYKLIKSGTVAKQTSDSNVRLEIDATSSTTVSARYVILNVKNIVLETANSNTKYYFIGTELEVYYNPTNQINYATATQGATVASGSGVTDVAEQAKILSGASYSGTNGAKDNGNGLNRYLALQLGPNGQYINQVKFAINVNTTATIYYSSAANCPQVNDPSQWTLLAQNTNFLAQQDFAFDLTFAKYINIAYDGAQDGSYRYIDLCNILGPSANTLSLEKEQLTLKRLIGSSINVSEASTTTITSNLNLYTTGSYDTIITWTSSNNTVVSPAGIVTRQATDQQVTLTATISNGTATPLTKTFTVIVLNYNITDAQAVDLDYTSLTDATILKTNTALNNVTTALNLPTVGAYSSVVSWQANVSGIIDLSTGNIITRDNFNDKSVTLTATISKGTVPSKTKTYTVTVKQLPFIEQAGTNPIAFEPIASQPKDNIVFLMAAAARRSADITVFSSGTTKHFWINNFGARPTDYLEWKINLPVQTEYHIDALLSATTSQSFKLYVTETNQSVTITPTVNVFDKIDAGKILLPAGISTLRFVKTSTDVSAVLIKSLELVKETARPAYLQRINQFKADTTWMANSKYGLMFQYGVWGQPQTGVAKSDEDATNSFDVPKFVQMVKSTGAGYVIWSITWWEYRMQAPIQAVDTIMGHSDFTSTRDLIGEIATALKAEGIGFMLYYHHGINQEPTWKDKQNWPVANFDSRGIGDFTTFQSNWKKVVTEIGNRYGTKLDGWFFDDGCTYYPAPFEAMGEAARAGNPKRFVSWNPWTAVRYTDFQDIFFAEGGHGEATTGSAPIGGNGVFTSGGQKGLLQHAMFMMENDWGIHTQNFVISTKITQAQAEGWLTSAMQRRVPLSFNMLMYEDGTVSQDSVNILKALKATYVDNYYKIESTSTLDSNGIGNIKLTRLAGYNSSSMSLVIAIYDSNNKLINFKPIALSQNQIPKSINSTSDIPISVQFPTGISNYRIKIFMIDTIANIKPLGVVQTISKSN